MPDTPDKHLPDLDKTVILKELENVTVQLKPSGEPVSSKTSGTPQNSGKLRNADREIKLTISGAEPLPANISDSGKIPPLSQVDSLYDFGEVIGSGGQGIIRCANDPGLQRDVAIKTLRRELNSSGQRRPAANPDIGAGRPPDSEAPRRKGPH